MEINYPQNTIGTSGRLVIMNNAQMYLSKIYNIGDWTTGIHPYIDGINVNLYSNKGQETIIASSKPLEEVESFAKIYNDNIYSSLTVKNVDHYFNVDFLRIFSPEELSDFNYKKLQGE